MQSEDVYFFNKKRFKLAGTIDKPKSGEIKNFAIFSHCFTCSKELKAIANIDSALCKSGIAVLRFDYTGIGKSEGTFTDSNYSMYLDDLDSAFEFLSNEFKAPSLYIGHSLGGCIAIESACSNKAVKAVAVIGTPAEPSTLAKKLKNTRERAIREGTGTANIGGIDFDFKPEFFEDLEKHNLKSCIENLNKPLLILHSPVDTYASIENASKIFTAAKHPKSFISLDDIDHLMLKKEDAIYAGSLIAAWSSKYL
jgi:alpha-beta hydrolase superfamily lysophospholipase